MEPLDPALREIIRNASKPLPPPDVERAVWKTILAQTTGVWLSNTVLAAIVAAAFSIGTVAGVGTTFWILQSRSLEAARLQGAQLPSAPPSQEVLSQQTPLEVTVEAPQTISRREHRTRQTAKSPEPPQQDGAEDSALRAERQWLETARQALVRGDGETALSLLQQAHERWPSGTLREERDALTVNALVLQGRGAEAHTAVSHFLSTYPESLFAESLKAALKTAEEDAPAMDLPVSPQ